MGLDSSGGRIKRSVPRNIMKIKQIEFPNNMCLYLKEKGVTDFLCQFLFTG